MRFKYIFCSNYFLFCFLDETSTTNNLQINKPISKNEIIDAPKARPSHPPIFAATNKKMLNTSTYILHLYNRIYVCTPKF